LQIACTELDGATGAFYKRKAVSFFIRQSFTGYEATSTLDGSDFVVREYTLDDELVPLTRPSSLVGHPFHRITWEPLDDYPSISKYHNLFVDSVFDSICMMPDFRYSNHSGIKIGGWPTPLQRSQEYPGAYDLQIDMTENFMYGDSGIAYVTRTGAHWHACFESC